MKYFIITILLVLLTGCINTIAEVDLGAERLDAIASIQDTIQIGKTDKTIAFTDDNTGENFIIKSDNKDYYSFGGDIIVYFSITNISKKDQDAYVAFSMGKEQNINYVKRFSHNEEIDYMPATATTSATTIKSAVWDDISFEDYDITKLKVERKSVLNRKVNKVFKDNFKVGETKYYKTSIQAPLEMTENEWFIEVLGQDYGHLK